MLGISRLRRRKTVGRAAIAVSVAVLITGCSAPTTNKWGLAAMESQHLGIRRGARGFAH